jgi:hypothetical protein
MGVHLADNGKIDIEMRVERLDGNVGSKRPVFPFMAKGEGGQCPVAQFHHQDHRVEDARDSGRG